MCPTRPQLVFFKNDETSDIYTATHKGELRDESREIWTSENKGDILKAFGELKEALKSSTA